MSAPRKLAASALVMTLAAIPVANAATGASAPRTLQTRQLEGALAAWRTSDPATVAALALQHGRRAKHVVVMQSHGAITVRGRLLAGGTADAASVAVDPTVRAGVPAGHRVRADAYIVLDTAGSRAEQDVTSHRRTCRIGPRSERALSAVVVDASSSTTSG